MTTIEGKINSFYMLFNDCENLFDTLKDEERTPHARLLLVGYVASLEALSNIILINWWEDIDEPLPIFGNGENTLERVLEKAPLKDKWKYLPKLFGKQSNHFTQKPWWSQFMELIQVRDRLVHPKSDSFETKMELSREGELDDSICTLFPHTKLPTDPYLWGKTHVAVVHDLVKTMIESAIKFHPGIKSLMFQDVLYSSEGHQVSVMRGLSIEEAEKLKEQ